MKDSHRISPFPVETFLPVNVLSWEDDVIFDAEEVRQRLIEEYSDSNKLPKCGWIPTANTRTYADFIIAWKSGDFLNSFKLPDEPKDPPRPILDADQPVDPDTEHSIFPKDYIYEMDDYRWEDDIIWDADNPPKTPPLVLDYDDAFRLQVFEEKEFEEPQDDERTVRSAFSRSNRSEKQCMSCGEYGHRTKRSKLCPLSRSNLEFSAKDEEIKGDAETESLTGNKKIWKCHTCGVAGHTSRSRACPFNRELPLSRASRRSSFSSSSNSIPTYTLKLDSILSKSKNTKSKMRCRACGGYGHTKANKKCPARHSLVKPDEDDFGDRPSTSYNDDPYTSMPLKSVEDWYDLLQSEMQSEASPKSPPHGRKRPAPAAKGWEYNYE